MTARPGRLAWITDLATVDPARLGGPAASVRELVASAGKVRREGFQVSILWLDEVQYLVTRDRRAPGAGWWRVRPCAGPFEGDAEGYLLIEPAVEYAGSEPADALKLRIQLAAYAGAVLEREGALVGPTPIAQLFGILFRPPM